MAHRWCVASVGVLVVLIGCAPSAGPRIDPGAGATPRPSFTPLPTATLTVAQQATIEAQATAIEHNNDTLRGSDTPLADPAQLLPSAAVLPGWELASLQRSQELDALGRDRVNWLTASYVPGRATLAILSALASPSALASSGALDQRARLDLSVNVFASLAATEPRVGPWMKPDPREDIEIALPADIGDWGLAVRRIHARPDFQDTVASATVRVGTLMVVVQPNYPITDQALIELARLVVSNARARLPSAAPFDRNTLAPPPLRPWSFLPSLAELGSGWNTVGPSLWLSSNTPLSADQHWDHRGDYGQVLESLHVRLDLYATPEEATGRSRVDATRDRAAEQRIAPSIGDLLTVHRSVHGDSEQYVLDFRRGRFVVEVDESALSTVAADRGVAIARAIDGRIVAAGGGNV